MATLTVLSHSFPSGDRLKCQSYVTFYLIKKNVSFFFSLIFNFNLLVFLTYF